MHRCCNYDQQQQYYIVYDIFLFGSIMIKIQSLREVISVYLLDKLCNGELESGQKLNIAFLTRELEVSATPLREALFGLAEKGVVEFVANKGFRLKPLSYQAAAECYEVIAHLDNFALSTSKPFEQSEIENLTELLLDLEKDAKQNKVSFQVLSTFENAFVANCPNSLLVEMCKELRIHTFPYEQLVLKNVNDLTAAFETHREIIQLIAENKFQEAGKMLGKTWQSCLPYLKNLLGQEL